MKAVLALTVLAAFVAVTESSVVPSYDNKYSDDVASVLMADNSNVAQSSDDTSIISVEESPETLPSRNEFSVIPSPRHFWEGSINPSTDRLLQTIRVRLNPIAGNTQRQEIQYTRVRGFTITAIRGFHVVPNQVVDVETIDGGVGQQFARLRLESARGGSIHYDVEFYGL